MADATADALTFGNLDVDTDFGFPKSDWTVFETVRPGENCFFVNKDGFLMVVREAVLDMAKDPFTVDTFAVLVKLTDEDIFIGDDEALLVFLVVNFLGMDVSEIIVGVLEVLLEDGDGTEIFDVVIVTEGFFELCDDLFTDVEDVLEPLLLIVTLPEEFCFLSALVTEMVLGKFFTRLLYEAFAAAA